MTIIERYLLKLFVKVFFVCFVSLTGLTIIIDAFSNLDEFITIAETQGNLGLILLQYYGSRTVTFFDQASPIITLIAAMFTIVWLQRTNELTALLAAGISKGRIILPVVSGAIVVALFAAGSREFVIPLLRERLAQNAGDMAGNASQALRPRYDNETDILMTGKSAFVKEQRIEYPQFRLPPALSGFARHVSAESAVYQPPGAGKPGGYLFQNVSQPTNLNEHENVGLGGKTIIYTSAGADWLKPGECFIASKVSFEQLVGGSNWRRFSSTPELIAGLRNPSFDFGADMRVTVHARVVQPFLDVTLLFLGLPLILGRGTRHIFLAAGLCLLLMAAYFLVLMGSHAMGSQVWISPALAAWLPLIIFAPLAYAMSAVLKE